MDQLVRLGNALLYSLCITVATLPLPSPAQAQGYVSPFVYDNGNFRNKTSSEMQRDQSYRQQASTSNPVPSTRAAEKINYEEMSRRNRERAEAVKQWKEAERKKAISNSSGYSDPSHQLLLALHERMYAMDYWGVDSITLVHLEQTASETFGNGPTDYAERLQNRIVSQYYLGKLDSAWQTTLRALAADRKRNSWDRDSLSIELRQCLLLLEVGAYDTLEAHCRSIISRYPAGKRYDNYLIDLYCFQSRVALARGKAAEARSILRDYMAHTDTSYVLGGCDGYPGPYYCETMGLIFQKQNRKDSALFYFRKAAKACHERTGLSGLARHYNIEPAATVCMAPVRTAFLEAARLGGYRLDDPADEGYQMLIIASLMGVPQATTILEQKIPFKPVAEAHKRPAAGLRK
jgi:hypothetical protein